MIIQSYWKQRRIRESNSALQKSINELDEKIKKYYLDLAERLKKEIAGYYGKILTDTPQDAVRTHQLLFGRQMELYNEIVKHLTSIGIKMENDMQKEFIDYYKRNYYLIGRQNQFNIIDLDNEAVRQAVNAVWVQDGKAWSQRVWDNMTNLENSLQKIMTDAISTGASVDRITETVMNDMNVGYYQANRLARTELSHIRVLSTLDSYRDAGVTSYEFIANGPNMCRECEEYNGQIFSIDDVEHLPPIHPNCVCTILAVLDEER